MNRSVKEKDAFRVMVVGDSISHGREGDWTWRYRIWQWFEQEGVWVDFVGPYAGTSSPDKPHPPRPPWLIDESPEPPPPLRTDGGYAKDVAPRFLANSNHFAAGGRQACQAKDVIAEQVASHQPDLCLVQLGFNDLGWRVSGPVETLASMKHLVDRARSAKPDLKFAMADIPYRTDLPDREDLPVSTKIYNDLLARSVPYWSTAESPVALVRFCENYSCGGSNSDAAYDGLHPNALGEYQIARAFSHTLVSDFKLGRSALAIPDRIPPRPLPTPASIRAVSAPSGITITWDAVYGAFGYDLQHRFARESDWESTHVDSNRYDQRWLQKGQAVECRVRASGGDTLKSPWTKVASAVADPQTAPAPTNMVTRATPTGFAISWEPPPPPYAGEIDRYGIAHFDSDQPGAVLCTVGVRGQSAEITGLTPGHRYYIAMETWTTAGGGIPAAARAVVVGRGTPPAAPTSVRAQAVTRLAVELTWAGMPAAAGYDIWVRDRRGVLRSLALCPSRERVVRVSDGSLSGGSMMKAVIPNMRPSVWEWEYAVEAYNGDNQSKLSEWVTPPPEAPESPEDMSLADTDSIHIALNHG
ncbi:carbohydrate esterase family 3 protein [Parathielavia hyrcaniae]|uniref:Carbohydrate esterase family 3 protein n=1 Tax=Parathielavia hyrcaniae TaxID=113614 RepID=A0AAN6Q0F9_9PEZI|nr:carbohydrate esterase family 3 protein [Parathielavia hyrcaniae]